MIKIIAGGKKTSGAYLELISEYEKRLRKPFAIEWQFMPEAKLDQYLADWPFTSTDFVICCDERGQNISSPEFSQRLEKSFMDGREVVILIGGAYGFSDTTRERADLVWSFSRLVFPHLISRLLVTEQIYRAQAISQGAPYHHQ